jgi:hypothetical protein
MREWQRVRGNRWSRGWWALVFLGLWPAIGWGTQAAAVGTLHMEGQGIEQLVLQDNVGRRNTFARPDANLVLPEGDYRIEQITLQGGYYCPGRQLSAEEQVVNVRAGAPAVLKFGAPLRQTVEVQRRGTVMVLNYSLLGRHGETYTTDTTEKSKRPIFAVHRGSWKVLSAPFPFG